MALVRPNIGSEVDDRGIPRNKRKQPLIIVPGKVKLVPYTRMTTFIDCLDSKESLSKWYRRMLLVSLQKLSGAELKSLVSDVIALDALGDKSGLDAIAARLHDRAGGNKKAADGDRLHKLSEYVDRGEPLPATVSELDVLDMAAYKLATRDLQVKRIEEFVVNDEFRVGGTPDRISWYSGLDPDGVPAGHLITDLKTGRTDLGGLKMAMQLAGYAHSKRYSPLDGTRADLPEDLNQRWGLIINLPAGTAACEVMWVDLTLGWDGFLLAKQVRAIRTRGAGAKAFRPFEPDNSSEPIIDDCDYDEDEL